MATVDERKTVLVTGCAPGGIGHALAVGFHARGLRVFATARRTEQLSSLSENGIETLPLVVDNDDSILACKASIEKLTNGRGLDYLVNNAGVSYVMPALDIDIAEANKVFDVNVFAVMRICQVFSPLLIESKGTIVMIGSLAGVVPYTFGSVYNASKAALHAYSNTLRVELAPLDVKVITVVTGGVKSRINAHVSRVLPRDSIYAVVEDSYIRRQGHSQEGAMSNEAYADSVINQVLPGAGPWPWRWLMSDARRKWIWQGNKSWLVYYLSGGYTWSVDDVPEPTFHVAYTPTLRMSHVDPAAIGRFAEEFVRPVRQQSRIIPLASVNMTISDVADALTRAAYHKKTVRVSYLSPDVAAQAEVNPFVAGQLLLNEREHLADVEKARSYGIELGSVEGFFGRRKEGLVKPLAS
ncbi:NADPH-dependent 1-acyl dihydroxyacetone phosphate reductase [Exophiala xenobiotica]|nr:NADPH-dependent 1-acyl dihydroxyacetone phosphate reductase [Exophiala xenobiotica]KAK5343732.1 NADPH-dependent 1-acyl dihydroxyacetone phosphate reductase [Exophiala xenobiotica]